MKPLAIDLYCGLGGWTEGLLVEGYEVIGFDIEQHVYGEHRYPAQLVIQDVLTLHGRQFKDAALIVASPPCQAYSWRAMPWKAAKAAPPPDNSLFEACFRIQREAIEAAGHFIPLVVENVRGAQKWVGRSRWNYGSYHLWGDVPALMPMTKSVLKGGWLSQANGAPMRRDDSVKVPGLDWSSADKAKRGCFRDSAIKNNGGSWFAVSHNKVEHSRGDEIKLGGSWFHGYKNGQGPRNHGSKSTKRKMASAMIAKIPAVLARHIAKSWLPQSAKEAAKSG